MAGDERLSRILETKRRNALLAWAVVGFLALIIVESIVTDDFLWAGFAAVVSFLALIPAIAYRRPAVMLPWEVLALAALPLIGRALATQELTGEFATYLAVAAIALIIAVELHAFTTVEMTPGFAIGFVVVATLAAAGIWAVVRWGLDVNVGTRFLLEPGVPEEEIETALMWEFVYSTGAGILGGLLFEGYFRRHGRTTERLPPEVTDA